MRCAMPAADGDSSSVSTQATDANSTGLVLEALRTVSGVADEQGIRALLALQVGCAGAVADRGGIAFQPDGQGGLAGDMFATVQATAALAEVALPITSATISSDVPTPCASRRPTTVIDDVDDGRGGRVHGRERGLDGASVDHHGRGRHERPTPAHRNFVRADRDRRVVLARGRNPVRRWRAPASYMTRLGMTRSVVRAIALTALAAFALATPLGGRALGRACASGDVHVAVVVDNGSSSAVSAVCVPGSSGDNGATILAARASMLGTPQPRYAASGLLCAIDGMPSTGCGVAHDGHYAYWSYWHGTRREVVVLERRSGLGTCRSRDVVEGWRWQPDGSALANGSAAARTGRRHRDLPPDTTAHDCAHRRRSRLHRRPRPRSDRRSRAVRSNCRISRRRPGLLRRRPPR